MPPITAEANRKQRLERAAEIERRSREIELRDLQSRVRSQQVWQTGVQSAVRNTVAYRNRQTLMNELEAMINPPPPAPEPTVVYVEAAEGSDQLGTPDFNPKLWMQKSRSWF